jgi:hypothetical protein
VGLGNVLNVAQEPAIFLGSSLQYWRGDKTWQTLNPAAVGAAPATSGTAILKGNNSGGFANAAAGTDYQSPLTFSQSIANSSGTVTLSGDSSSPGNSMLYGTNGSGIKGWYSQPSGGGGMAYPGAGVPLCTGSAWGTSYAVGTSANDLVQLNSSGQLPAVSGANLTNLTAAMVGAAPATSGTSILKGNGSGGTTAAVSNTDYAAVRDNGDPTYLWNGNKLLSRISDVWASITGGNLIVWGSNVYGTNLATVISTIGSTTPANLIVPPGTFAISANTTVTPNIRLLPHNGALITISNGVHLNINGPFEAGLYQVFNDQNTSLNGVQFTVPQKVYSTWWGSALTDVPIQSAINSLPNGGHVWIPDGTYVVIHAIGVVGISRITVEGESWNTILDSSATTNLTGTGGVTLSAAYPSLTPTLNPGSLWGTIFFDTPASSQAGDITLRNLTVKSCATLPTYWNQKTVAISAVNNFTLDHCQIYGGYYENVYTDTDNYTFGTATGRKYFHNTFYGPGLTSPGPAANGIDVNSQGITDILVDGNTFYSYPLFAVRLSGTGQTVVNNRIYKCQLGIEVNEGNTSPSIIANNQIFDVGYLTKGTAESFVAGIITAISGETHGVLVTGNTIQGIWSNGAGISLAGNVTASNNSVSYANEVLSGTGPSAFLINSQPTTANMYLINNVVEASTLATKFFAGVFVQWSTSAPNDNVYIMGGSYSDSAAAVGNHSGANQANITISNAIMNGTVYGCAGNINSITPPANVPFSGNTNSTLDSVSGFVSTPTVLTPGAHVAISAGSSETFTLTPGQAETITVTGGVPGQDLYLAITTSGTSSYTLTFSTGFYAAGTLSTGSVSAKQFMLHFVNVGGTFTEVSRTAAM